MTEGSFAVLCQEQLGYFVWREIIINTSDKCVNKFYIYSYCGVFVCEEEDTWNPLFIHKSFFSIKEYLHYFYSVIIKHSFITILRLMSLHTVAAHLHQWLKHKRAHGIVVLSEWKNIVMAAGSSLTYWHEIVLKIFKNKIKYTFIYEKLLSSLRLSAIVEQKKWHACGNSENWGQQYTLYKREAS